MSNTKELRRVATGGNELSSNTSNALLRDAADELEYLTAERDRLRKALEPFSLIAEWDIGSDESDSDLFQPMARYNAAPRLLVGDFRRAAKILENA